jgi:hypothetical protein
VPTRRGGDNRPSGLRGCGSLVRHPVPEGSPSTAPSTRGTPGACAGRSELRKSSSGNEWPEGESNPRTGIFRSLLCVRTRMYGRCGGTATYISARAGRVRVRARTLLLVVLLVRRRRGVTGRIPPTAARGMRVSREPRTPPAAAGAVPDPLVGGGPAAHLTPHSGQNFAAFGISLRHVLQVRVRGTDVPHSGQNFARPTGSRETGARRLGRRGGPARGTAGRQGGGRQHSRRAPRDRQRATIRQPFATVRCLSVPRPSARCAGPPRPSRPDPLCPDPSHRGATARRAQRGPIACTLTNSTG